MAKSREEILNILKGSFARDNSVNPGSMNWRAVYLATVESFNNKQHKLAQSYVNDMSLSDLRTCRDLVEDLYMEEFLQKLEAHMARVKLMSQTEMEECEAEFNELLPPEKLAVLADRLDSIILKFVNNREVEEEEKLPRSQLKKSKKSYDTKN